MLTRGLNNFTGMFFLLMFDGILGALWSAGFVAVAAGADLPAHGPVGGGTNGNSADAPIFERAALKTGALPLWSHLDRWSFQAGVGFILESTVDDVATFQSKTADGKAGGQIYLVQVSYKAAQFRPAFFGRTVAVDAELPFVLGVVQEHGGEPFLQYSGGFALRWKTFPWNRWVYSNLETGIGLTYSQQVLETERERHAGENRSHLEFYWPVQLMVAAPRWPEHQLVFFLHHHSGGAIFHVGGANTIGLGYRYVPGEHINHAPL